MGFLKKRHLLGFALVCDPKTVFVKKKKKTFAAKKLFPLSWRGFLDIDRMGAVQFDI